jgi:hypothetical protein
LPGFCDERRFWGGLYLFALFWLTACGNVGQAPLPTAVLPLTLPAPPTPQPLATPTGPLPPTPVANLPETAIPTATTAATATAVPPSLTLSAAPGVPGDLRAAAQALAAARPGQFAWVEAGEADVTLTLGAGTPLAEWIYVVAAPFATVQDEVALPDLNSAGPLFAPAEVAAWDTAVFTPADPRITYLTDPAEMVESAWAERPSLLILPFHQLRPELKLLRLDGVSPLTADFDPTTYPLTVTVNVAGAETAVADFLAAWQGLATNWDPGKLTRVAMTGVTALTRATAYQMEIGGVLGPGTAVGPVLQSADIAHVSNEVSFTPDCPYPDPIGGTTFCSRESYFELLTWLGIDVVELTGNHVNDWGTDALLHSLDLYDGAGMAVFGGGADAAAAQQPALFEHNGNRLAFVGCNPVGPAYAWAGEAKPGSRFCDETFYGPDCRAGGGGLPGDCHAAIQRVLSLRANRPAGSGFCRIGPGGRSGRFWQPGAPCPGFCFCGWGVYSLRARQPFF